MKKSLLGMAVLLPIVALTACSDDDSSAPVVEENPGSVVIPGQTVNPGQTVSPGQTIVPGNTSVTDSGSTVNPGSQTNPGNVSTPIEEDITEKPISAEEKQPDGTESVSALPFDIKGVAELGPFKSGASLKVSSVDASTMAVSASAVSGTVSSDLGTFTAKGNLTSAIASIEVSGKYLEFTMDGVNETSGIRALVDLRNRKTANVNILTTLEYDRVVSLVGQGLSFTAAKARAEKEVIAALGLHSDTTLFEDISLYDLNVSGANLLAISSIVLTERSASDVDALLKAVAADIGADGKWDDEVLRAELADLALYMDASYPGSVLADHNNNADIQFFRSQTESFWAAQYNLGSCGASNQNEIKANGNSHSKYVNKNFICSDSLWAIATDAMILNVAATNLFGECTDANAGTMKQNDGAYFICKKKSWSAATDADLKNMEIASTKGECNSSKAGDVVNYESAYYMCVSGVWTKLNTTPIDYSKGRAMNKKLGRGINFGNSWEAPSNDDSGWSNPINDGDFSTVKAAGFNSVRIPVRWYTGMDNKLNGVKADVTTAINAGLVVIINYHHYQPMYDAAKNGSLDSKISEFSNEWKKIAQTFDSFDDDKLVFEIFNEPHDMTQDQVNKIMTAGYNAIRSVSKGKTIMFESNGYSKFAQITKLDLPNDGNIIVSGHYYEPYTFTHQGHGYDCNGNAGDGISSMAGHFKAYADSIAAHFPDINGGSVPMNVGEFGVANKGSCSSISDSKRDAWTKTVVEQAEKYGMSWHYWCFKNCGGFEASNGSSWHSNMLSSFKLK